MNRKNVSTFLSFAFLIFVISSSILSVFSLQNNMSILSHGTVNYSGSSTSSGVIYLIYQGRLVDSNGNPNANAQRLHDSKIAYGRPEWVELSNWGGEENYPGGMVGTGPARGYHWTQALIDYFHSVGIKCSARVWSNGLTTGLKPIAQVKGDIDWQMTQLSSDIDAFMVDECSQDWYAGSKEWYQEICDYIHAYGKLVFLNPGNKAISLSTCQMADVVSTEHSWYGFTLYYQDLIAQFPKKFLGSSNDWGYANEAPENLPPTWAEGDRPAYTVPLSLERAVWDTKYAWQHGVYWMDIKQHEGYTIPDWWEAYLSQLPK